MKLVERLPFDVLAQNRSGRLTDRTAFAVEERLFDLAGSVELQLHPNLIAAQRIFFAVSTRRAGDVPLVIRGLVMVEDVVVVKFFVQFGTDSPLLF